MTLLLSDDQLARLRLECVKHLRDGLPAHLRAGKCIQEHADELVAWCLRDRPVEPEVTE